MPNWCMNKLTIRHDDKSMIEKFDKAYRNDSAIETFLPTPRDPNDPDRIVGDNAPVPDGMLDWHSWRLANWGTKWDIGCGIDMGMRGLEPTIVDNELNVTFDSAWSPPLGFYERLVVLGFDVQASYFEPGMSFAGIWDNGADTYYEGHWKDFPEALRDEFDMHEYYDELEVGIEEGDEKM